MIFKIKNRKENKKLEDNNIKLDIFKVISVGEAAELLGMDRTSIRKSIRKNLIEDKDYRISKGTILVELAALITIYPELINKIEWKPILPPVGG